MEWHIGQRVKSRFDLVSSAPINRAFQREHGRGYSNDWFQTTPQMGRAILAARRAENSVPAL